MLKKQNKTKQKQNFLKNIVVSSLFYLLKPFVFLYNIHTILGVVCACSLQSE
jgi:amino acid permease